MSKAQKHPVRYFIWQSTESLLMHFLSSIYREISQRHHMRDLQNTANSSTEFSKPQNINSADIRVFGPIDLKLISVHWRFWTAKMNELWAFVGVYFVWEQII